MVTSGKVTNLAVKPLHPMETLVGPVVFLLSLCLYEKGSYKMQNAKVQKCEKWPKNNMQNMPISRVRVRILVRLGLGLGLD